MPHLIEAAKSNRASCRQCREKISKVEHGALTAEELTELEAHCGFSSLPRG